MHHLRDHQSCESSGIPSRATIWSSRHAKPPVSKAAVNSQLPKTTHAQNTYQRGYKPRRSRLIPKTPRPTCKPKQYVHENFINFRSGGSLCRRNGTYKLPPPPACNQPETYMHLSISAKIDHPNQRPQCPPCFHRSTKPMQRPPSPKSLGSPQMRRKRIQMCESGVYQKAAK